MLLLLLYVCDLSGMMMQKFDDYLKMADVTVWLKLQQQDIKPQYYAFRWLTLLLSQEFELPGMQTDTSCLASLSPVFTLCNSVAVIL